MQEIARAVQEGAAAYLRRQYMTIGLVAIVPFLLIGFYNQLGWGTAIGFLIGAVFSAAAGFIGMNVAVRANVRTAEAAKQGLKPALNVAFRAGSVTGLLVVGLGLFGVAGYYGVLTSWFDIAQDDAIDDLIGLAFGGSLISVFARLGGGIYTKAADVGADLVGKIEAGIPEDDPRNPAVIADNVGDNVGDCAGMAADLFETYAVTAVAVMLLGTALPRRRACRSIPLALGGVSIIASVIGILFARVGRGGSIMNALYKAVVVATVLSAIGFIPVTMAFDEGAFSFGELYVCRADRPRHHLPARRDHRVLHRHPLGPGEVDLARLPDRPRDEHHRGARGRDAGDRAARDRDRGRDRRRLRGLRRQPLRHRRRRHGAALDDRPDRRARRLRAGHGQRRRHRRDGRPGRVRPRASPTRSTRSGTRRRRSRRATRSARPASPRSSSSTSTRAGSPRKTLPSVFALNDPWVIAGLFIGGPDAVPLRFARDAGGRPRRRPGGRRGAPPVPRDPRHPRGHRAARLQPSGRHRHGLGHQEDAPARRSSRSSFPIIVGIISPEALGGLLIGTIVTGIFLAIAMTSGGGAWDNAKKLIEDGAYGGKGSEAHAAAVTGDTVGDPYKDTAGPAINPMIKIANIVAILIIPIIASIHG